MCAHATWSLCCDAGSATTSHVPHHLSCALVLVSLCCPQHVLITLSIDVNAENVLGDHDPMSNLK
jgi:hypothetical protein